MKLLDAGNAQVTGGYSGLLPLGQVVFLLLFLSIGIPCIFATITTSSYITIFLFIFVAVYGLLLCHKTQSQLGDSALNRLGYFWLLKITLVIFLLYAGWMPELDWQTSGAWGYDPQRFYMQAQELVENKWVADFVSLNYTGILYYYGAIFYLLGHNPLVPALINVLVTLIASLYLIRVCYEIKRQRSSRDWTIAFSLLLPELLWFDVMTSRETLLAALLLFSLLTAGRYLLRSGRVSLLKASTVVVLSVLLIAAVRTSMVLPVVASILLMVVFVRPVHGGQLARRLIALMGGLGLLLVFSSIPTLLGGYGFDFGKVYSATVSATENVALSGDMSWSGNSIGLLLMPEGILQSVLFLPPRMLLYLLAPLPNISIPVSDLVNGSWNTWQNLLVLLSSLLNLLLVPYVMASFFYAVKTRNKYAGPLVFHLSYILVFMAVAGGNLIIHERYRVMATLLFWGCAWLGMQDTPKELVRKAVLAWYSLLVVCAGFYLYYKAGMLA